MNENVVKQFKKKEEIKLTSADVKRIKSISKQIDKLEKDIEKESKHIDIYNSKVLQIEALKYEVDQIKKRG